MADSSLLTRLDGIEARFEEVSTLITDPSVIADMKRYVRLTKEYKDLEKLTGATRNYKHLLDNIAEAREILETENDDEMRVMAKEELDSATSNYLNWKRKLNYSLFLPTLKMAKMQLLKSEVEPVVMKLQSLQVIYLKCTANTASLKVGACQ